MLLVCCVGCLCAVLFCNAMQDGKSLQISVTMPSIEVGTVGGGTHLPAQSGCLDICNTKGAAKEVQKCSLAFIFVFWDMNCVVYGYVCIVFVYAFAYRTSCRVPTPFLETILVAWHRLLVVLSLLVNSV